MKFKKTLQSMSAIALIFALSGCLENESRIARDSGGDFANVQAAQYAQALQDYAMQSGHLVTSDISWSTGTFTEGEEIDFAALGGSPHQRDDVLFSSVCRINDTKALHLTWLESTGSDGSFQLKGIGKNAQGILYAALSEVVSESSLAQAESGDLRLAKDDNLMAIPSGCSSLDIPSGAPVIMTELEIPAVPDHITSRKEYQVVACDGGMDGHIVQERTVTTIRGDVIDETAWSEFQSTCKNVAIASAWETTVSTAEGLAMGAVATSGTAGGVLDGALREIECRDATSKDPASEAANNSSSDNMICMPEGDGQWCHDPQTGEGEMRYPGTVPNSEDQQSDDYTSAHYDTCGDGQSLSGFGDVNPDGEITRKTEQNVVNCGGTAGTFTDSIGGYIGTASHTTWNGTIEYKRDIITHASKTDVHNASTAKRQYMEKWEGASLNCSRPEELNITCASVYPGVHAQNDTALTDSRGFNYQRTSEITGWKSAGDMVPNDPVIPSWTYQESQSGCRWQETDNWDCTVGDRQTQSGERIRYHTANTLGASPTVTGWDTQRNAQCIDNRTTTTPISCADGSTGTETTRQRRTYTSQQPGSGSWGSWITVSSSDNCPPVNCPPRHHIVPATPYRILFGSGYVVGDMYCRPWIDPATQ